MSTPRRGVELSRHGESRGVHVEVLVQVPAELYERAVAIADRRDMTVPEWIGELVEVTVAKSARDRVRMA